MGDGKTAAGKWGWQRMLLVGSLAVNLAVAGVVIGAVVSHGPDKRRDVRGDDIGSPYTRALSREDRRDLGRAVREAGGVRPSRAEMGASFDAVVAALRAEPYDGAAVAALMGAQFDRIMERQTRGQVLLLERLEAMTGQERRAYADRLTHALERFTHDHKVRDGKDRD